MRYEDYGPVFLVLSTALVVKSVQQGICVAVDWDIRCVCEDTGVVCEEKNPCGGNRFWEERLRPESRCMRGISAVSPRSSGVVFCSFGVEPMDKDNIEVRVRGRDEHFDVLHDSALSDGLLDIEHKYTLETLTETKGERYE